LSILQTLRARFNSWFRVEWPYVSQSIFVHSIVGKTTSSSAYRDSQQPIIFFPVVGRSRSTSLTLSARKVERPGTCVCVCIHKFTRANTIAAVDHIILHWILFWLLILQYTSLKCWYPKQLPLSEHQTGQGRLRCCGHWLYNCSAKKETTNTSCK
jgi:hypothetical protein